MPRDYDPMAKAVSGFLRGRGPGRIAGGPEGTSRVNPVTRHSSGKYPAPLPGDGVIRGNPVGIKGRVRRPGKGLEGAVKRRIGRMVK